MLHAVVVALSLVLPTQQNGELPPMSDPYGGNEEEPKAPTQRDANNCEDVCQITLNPCYQNCEKGNSNLPNCLKACQTSVAHCAESCASAVKKANESKGGEGKGKEKPRDKEKDKEKGKDKQKAPAPSE